MDIVFRRIPFNSPRIAPPGELHVRSLDAKDDTALAKLALNGRASFVGGDDPNPLALVIHDNPTLDDMLAALFLIHRVPHSASADHFARYAESVRRGLSPTRAGGRSSVPVERTLEAVFEILRHNAVEGAVGAKSNYGSLLDAACAARFLSDWRRLGDLILDKIKAAVDPHLQPLFDDNSNFQNELTFLGNDHATYCRERDAGQRFLVQLSNGGPPVAALVVSERTSYLFVRFARADDQAPDGHKFHLLGIKDPDEGWIISTDPLDRYNLKPLADRLQDAETAATPKGETPHVWRDGAPHKHTIIFPPETGSRLSDVAVIDTIKKWGNAKPVPKRLPAGLLSTTPPARSRWPMALGGVGLTAAIFAAVFFLPRPPAPSTSSKPSPPSVKLDPRIEVFARGEANEPSVAETMKLGQKLSPHGAETPRLKPGASTDAIFNLSNPGGRKLPIKGWLQFIGKKPPPENVVLETSGRKIIPISWSQSEPDSIIWKSAEFRQIEIEGVAPTFKATVTEYQGPEREFSVELNWRPDYELHLYFLAIGIGTYTATAGVQNLDCPAGDARDLTAAIRTNCRNLFNQIDCPDALTDDKATRGDIIDALDAMRQRITADPAPMKLAMVFFAGHGIICEPQYFAFLPYDYIKGRTANVISANDIKDRIGELTCPAVLILDSCHSGQAALDIFLKGTRGESNSRILEEAVQSFEQEKGGLFVLTACQADKLALEDKKVWGHGALCKALLEKLDGAPGVARSGVLTLKDLNDYAGQRVGQLIELATGSKSTVIPAFPPGRLPQAIPIAYFPPEK